MDVGSQRADGRRRRADCRGQMAEIGRRMSDGGLQTQDSPVPVASLPQEVYRVRVASLPPDPTSNLQFPTSSGGIASLRPQACSRYSKLQNAKFLLQ